MLQPSRFLFALLLFSLASSSLVAQQAPELAPGHPQRYVVVKGDTLWDVAARFLRDPWRWPEIWHINPQVANPHLIYPGDELELIYVNGQPRINLNPGDRTVKLTPEGHVKLGPRVRIEPYDGTIPLVPVDAISAFLNRPYVFDQKDEIAPYVVAFADEHVIGGAGQRIYVRAIHEDSVEKFDILRLQDPYRDGVTDEILGYEALYLGTAQLQRLGDPATLLITAAKEEVLTGDILVPSQEDRALRGLLPEPPDRPVSGRIIRVFGGVSQIGRHQVIALDRGERDGLAPGTVLAVDQYQGKVRDQVTKDPWDEILLPDERSGTALVFRTFERVSFALLMKAVKPIKVGDKIRNP